MPKPRSGFHWPCVDIGGWRDADHRGDHDPRQGPHDGHRQPQGRDEGSRSRPRTAMSAPRRSNFGIKPPLFDTRDIHVHVPEGATPKDGPSAGVGMATAIVSVMTGIPVNHDVPILAK